MPLISTIARSLLDRPGGRALLSQLATARVRLRGNGTRVFYDGCWLQESDGTYVADWRPNTGRNLTALLNQARRHWLTFYEPAEGDIVLDVGAGVGIEAVLLSRAVGTTGRVIALEAHPRTYTCLCKTCEYNGLKNVTPINIALADREHTVFITDEAQHIGNAISVTAGTVPVRGRTLDNLCGELRIDRITLLRMNIEGAERLAIDGMKRMIDRTTYAAIACHDFKADRTGDDFFRTKRLVVDFLTAHGFRIVRMGFDEVWARDHVYAYNPSLASNPLERI